MSTPRGQHVQVTLERISTGGTRRHPGRGRDRRAASLSAGDAVLAMQGEATCTKGQIHCKAAQGQCCKAVLSGMHNQCGHDASVIRTSRTSSRAARSTIEDDSGEHSEYAAWPACASDSRKGLDWWHAPSGAVRAGIDWANEWCGAHEEAAVLDALYFRRRKPAHARRMPSV
jgi:hypothetical protein